MVYISVVVPCFNEQANLTRLHAELDTALAAISDDYEVILVDDGSTDDTLMRLRDAAATDTRFRYLSLSRNFGKESAMLAGLSHARGSVIAIMDADLQHPPELLSTMVPMIGEGYEQVVARRTRVGDPAVRTLLSRGFYFVMNRMADLKLQDGVGDFRVLSRTAVVAILSLGEYTRFSKGLFQWIGFKTAVVDYDNVARTSGTTKWGFRSLMDYGIDGVLAFNTKPLRLAIWLGTFVALVAFGYAVWVLGDAVLNGNPVPGYVTTICAVVGFGGVQMILLGVIGEYLARIYQETKARPHFLIAESESGRGAEAVATALGPGTVPLATSHTAPHTDCR